MKAFNYFFICALSLFVTTTAFAQANRVYRTSLSLIPLTTSTKQAGNGPEGSTVMTQFEFGVHKPFWGYGLFYQYDQHGDFQKDLGLGLKLEANYKALYMDVGYLVSVQRIYADRTYEKETGDGYYFGLGARVELSKRYFFNLTYKYRVHNIKKQDDISLSDPIIQTDSYPLLGLGVSF
ncbi:MAG: hypothetical protein V4654_14675 [Bdellovibrionota bacterium]